MLRPSSGENRRAPEMCSESLSATSRVAAARRGASCAESCAAAQDADGGHGHCGSASGGGPGAPRGAAL